MANVAFSPSLAVAAIIFLIRFISALSFLQPESQSKLLDILLSLEAVRGVSVPTLLAVPALPKLVKKVTKTTIDATVKSTGKKLIKKWKRVVTEQQGELSNCTCNTHHHI